MQCKVCVFVAVTLGLEGDSNIFIIYLIPQFDQWEYHLWKTVPSQLYYTVIDNWYW